MATKKKDAPKAAPKQEAPAPVVEQPNRPTRREQEIAWQAPQPHALDDLLAKGDLVARYLEQHGTWEEHAHLTHLGRRIVRVLRYCECPICQDAVKALGLTE